MGGRGWSLYEAPDSIGIPRLPQPGVLPSVKPRPPVGRSVWTGSAAN